MSGISESLAGVALYTTLATDGERNEEIGNDRADVGGVREREREGVRESGGGRQSVAVAAN